MYKYIINILKTSKLTSIINFNKILSYKSCFT